MNLFAGLGGRRAFARSPQIPPHERKALAPASVTPPRPALARAFGTSIATGEWPQSYEAQVREAYLKNPVAQRAVRLIAEGVAAVPLNVTAADPAQAPAALRLLKATSAGQVLIEAATAHILLHGNAFVQLLRDAHGDLADIYALRPERVTIEADGRGWPLAYRYRVNDSITRIGAVDPLGRAGLVHIKGMNPLDDHYGLGCLGAASGAIAIHNAATKWNKILLDNAARPSGALIYNPGEPGATLSGEQFDRLRAEVDAHFSGAGNAGRPLLLEGGLSWQSLSLSPIDMDFINLKAASAREIALAFGVPPVLLGLPGDATYSNYREATRALWRMTIIPLAEKILDAIAEGMRGWIPDLAFRVDLDGISALADDREKLWQQVSNASFLTDLEKRDLLGLAPGAPELTTPDLLEEL